MIAIVGEVASPPGTANLGLCSELWTALPKLTTQFII